MLADFVEEKPKNDFSDPVYHELAILNGEINRLDSDQLDHALTAFNLSSKGCYGVKQKRLKSYVREKKQEIAGLKPRKQNTQPLDYLLIIDFEATCHEENPPGFLYEIIEFPIILIDVANRKIVDIFHEKVKPKINAELSKFCTELTGITQEQVERADPFVNVFERAQVWMANHGLFEPGVNFLVVTDGPWDIARFLIQQCMIDYICIPLWASRWVNLRKTFTNYYKLKYYPKLPDITQMLDALGLKFEGRLHCGLDDAKNCATIMLTLLDDLCHPEFNEFIAKYGYSWMVEPREDTEDNSKKAIKWRTPQKKRQQALKLETMNADPAIKQIIDCEELEKKLTLEDKEKTPQKPVSKELERQGSVKKEAACEN